jgi:hypothetical protein
VGKYRYTLPRGGASLARIFEIMEEHKRRLGVVNYAASQPTLEAIFLDICGAAAERVAPRGSGGGGGGGDGGGDSGAAGGGAAGGGGGGGDAPRTRVAPAVLPPTAQPMAHLA